jgi:hypothetical protein
MKYDVERVSDSKSQATTLEHGATQAQILQVK